MRKRNHIVTYIICPYYYYYIYIYIYIIYYYYYYYYTYYEPSDIKKEEKETEKDFLLRHTL